jgi:hypothetical protein
MAVQTVEMNLGPLRQSLQVARRHLWLQRGIRIFALSVCISMGTLLLASLLALWQAPENVRAGLWAAGALAPVAGIVVALLMRPSISEAARAVDFRLGLNQQLGTAEELLTTGARGGLVSMQVARAVSLAEEVEVEHAFPIVPRRELVVSVALAAMTGFVMFLVSLGITLPNPFSGFNMPSFERKAEAAIEQDVLGIRQQREAPGPNSPAMDPVRESLEELRRQAQAGTLTGAAAAALLGQANAELNRIASESRAHQQALESLAGEMRGTAAGREAAESLRQGDFERAAQQLQEAGRRSDQMSTAAKQELPEALDRAAGQSQQSQSLAQSEAAAAEALQSGSYSSTVQSMDDLSEAVQDTAGQIVSQSEIAEAWQQMEELAQQLGEMGALDRNTRSALSRPVAQAPQGGTERSSQMQEPAGDGGSPEGSMMGPPEGQMQSEMASGGQGQPGTTRGDSPLGDEGQSLGTGGNHLDIQGRLADRFSGSGEPGSQPPSVLREGTDLSVSSGQSQGITGRTTVPAENVLVPGALKSTIRDYFSRR